MDPVWLMLVEGRLDGYFMGSGIQPRVYGVEVQPELYECCWCVQCNAFKSEMKTMACFRSGTRLVLMMAMMMIIMVILIITTYHQYNSNGN